nr:AraC family transcriptional regulator [Bacillus sp. FJAT-50079]
MLLAIEKAKETINHRKKYRAIQNKAENLDDHSVLNLLVWNSNRDKSKHVNAIIDYIQENYQEKISIEDLVEELGVSTTYLNKKFKESTNYTFNEFLNRYRIQKAIELIERGEDKISMIALDVGYSNYRYFIKVFKKYTNFLPSDFGR